MNIFREGDTIRKKVVNMEKNCHRLLDAADLFDAAYEECKKLYDDGKREKDIVQPYIVDDIVIDIYPGQVVIYYHDNTPA